MVALEGGIQRLHHAQGALPCGGAVGAQYNAVRAQEIVNRCAFFQEFRVRHHGEGVQGIALHQHAAHFIGHSLASAHRHSRFVDDHLKAIHVRGNLLGHFVHMAQVSAAVFAGRRAHTNENQLGMVHRVFNSGGEIEALLANIAFQQFIQTGFVNRTLAVFKLGNFGFVNVATQNFVAHFGQTGGCNQAHISTTNN